jgi:hypothetical protein
VVVAVVTKIYLQNHHVLGQRNTHWGFEKLFSLLSGGKKKEYKHVCVKPWRTWKYFELGKIKFHMRYFVFSKIQNIL